MTPEPIIYIVVGVYCVLMVGVGVGVSHLNKNEDDFLRGGAKGTCWLVGISLFMSGFSTFTFTGAAKVVFEAGWSVTWMFLGNVVGFLICALWFAPWFRQMRIMAQPQVLVKRYGEHLGQFYTWVFIPTAPIYPAIGLLSLGIFVSTFFGFPMEPTLIILGLIVLIYTIFGGAWATMATDFLQGVIIIPFTIIIAILCFMKIGGLEGFFGAIENQGLEDVFTFTKSTGEYANNQYNWVWMAAIVLNVVKGFISLGGAGKFRLVKDGNDARKAALLAAGLFMLGPIVWVIPPAVSRLFYADSVLAAQIAEPTEAAYAIAAMEVLPTALMGVLIVSMFSATMSSLDTAMNGVVGGWVKVAYPGLMRFLKRTPTEDGKKLLLMSRVITALYGLAIIGIAIKFHRDGRGVFDILMSLMAFLTASGIPILWGLIIRNVPPWAPYVTIILGMIPAVMGAYSETLFGEAWNFQTKFFVNMGVGTAIFMSTTLFWRRVSPEFKVKVEQFFIEVNTPIDVEKEVGETKSTDVAQLRIVGGFALLIGFFICLLALVPQSPMDRVVCLALGLSVALVGGILFGLGQRAYLRLKTEHDPQS